jgi:hypothetical protein
MAATANHIVNKFTYHVHGVPVSKAFSVKEDAAAYIKGSFSNKIQVIFDTYFAGADNVYIDKLQLDIKLLPGEINLDKYEKQLLDLLEKQLQKKATVNQAGKKLSEEIYQQQQQHEVNQNKQKDNFTPAHAFTFFLEKGYFPWWFKVITQQVFEQQLIAYFTVANNENISLLAKCIINAGLKVMYRFMHQFSDDFKFELAAILLQQPAAAIKTLLSKLTEAAKENFIYPAKKQKKILHKDEQIRSNKSIEMETAFMFWNLCFNTVEAEAGNRYKKFKEVLENALHKIIATKNISVLENEQLAQLINEGKKELQLIDEGKKQQQLSEEIKQQAWQPQKNDAAAQKTEEQDIANDSFINNAGLVLLHPFLATLFIELLVVKDDTIIDHAKAIACLNYLCGFGEMQPEFEWPLMKILCSMEIAETVKHLYKLTDADKLECNALLQQVVDYWIALKQTSVQGLQQTFIQRFGKLSVNENGWLLQVEQKTVDILKDRLPWGVSMVKLPWMKRLLKVEW